MFINGECLISYVCKLIIDNHYITGSNHEMEYLLPTQTGAI